jgi:hypothetical protein
VLLVVVFNFLAFAEENKFAGTWKLNPEKSSGPPPICLAMNKGILQIPREIHTVQNPCRFQIEQSELFFAEEHSRNPGWDGSIDAARLSSAAGPGLSSIQKNLRQQ